jgi:glycosyltransferase involved in cell wall biosynthesis
VEAGGKPLKIINAVLSKQNGGLEQASVDYANALRLYGHDVTMLVGDRCPFTADVLATDSEIYTLTNRFGHMDFPAMWQLRRWLKTHRPDVIFAHGNRAVSLLRKAAVGIAPVVSVNHTTSVKRSLDGDGVIMVNAQLKQALLDCGHKNPHTIWVLPNMVTVTPEQAARRIAPMPQTPPVIGALARFSPEKGLFVLLESLAILKNKGVTFRVRVGGDGPMRNEIEAAIRQHGLVDDVELCGWVADRDAFYDSLDVYCLPSLAETFGIVVLEAMQRKLPVVATSCVGVNQLTDGRDAALLVPVGDAVALADALERMLADWPLAQHYAAAGYALVSEKYDIQIVAGQLQKIMTEVIAHYTKGVDA